MRSQRALYDEMIELLSLRQYKPLMFGDMSYKSKAERAKRVSRSKRVHTLADQIIALHNKTTWFRGFEFPNNELIKTLIHAHVVATQEFDHHKADVLETCLVSLGMGPAPLKAVSRE